MGEVSLEGRTLTAGTIRQNQYLLKQKSSGYFWREAGEKKQIPKPLQHAKQNH